MVEHNGAVAALVIDGDGKVVLVDQWRHARGAGTLEVTTSKYNITAGGGGTRSAASWPRSSG